MHILVNPYHRNQGNVFLKDLRMIPRAEVVVFRCYHQKVKLIIIIIIIIIIIVVVVVVVVVVITFLFSEEMHGAELLGGSVAKAINENKIKTEFSRLARIRKPLSVFVPELERVSTTKNCSSVE